MHSPWEENIEYIKEYYGNDFINYDEGYYQCPICGDVVYEYDWKQIEFAEFRCPICEWKGD